MSLQPLGSMSVGDLLPAAVAAATQLSVTATVTLPRLQANLDDALNANASLSAALTVPLDPTTALRQALALFTSGQLVAALTAGIAEIGVSVQADLAVNTALLELLRAALQQLEHAVDYSAALLSMLALPGIEAYAGPSSRDALGNDVSAAAGSGSPAPVHALLVVVQDPAVWAALSTLVRVQ